ncbi:hypothetical protein [Phenylobacterium sp.]|jgi:hypothetical protein|uniref:hypothetical protein n=1 Tax=Phenylobacterium sp. TaxID=1871053 RepID=UPI002E31E516|nr:hypothetical protein [Phenylobacterium sp.]HEX3366921.1 hypothetical protein [Phenylobacterium sp.]
MKSLLLLSACGLTLGVAACAPRTPVAARVALDCPSDRGDLKLTGSTPDKKTCTYVTSEGDQVSLRLIPVSTTYEAALQPIEQELQTEVPTAQEAAKATEAKAAENVAKASSATAADAAKAAKQAAEDAVSQMRDAKRDRDHDGDTDGKIGVTAGDDHGDHADINLPGIHISADDDNAKVNVGMVHVDAGEDGATVRVARDVRLRGEALSPQRRGFRATYVLAKDNLKDGWKTVGYEAGGPKAGPITVAVFKVHDGHRRNVSEDVKRLVRENGGV